MSARQRSEPRNVRLDRPVRRRRCGLTAAQHQKWFAAYQWLRHPNYAVVTGEFAAVPLALGLLLCAFAFTILNAAVLAIRIPAENAALAAAASGRAR